MRKTISLAGVCAVIATAIWAMAPGSAAYAGCNGTDPRCGAASATSPGTAELSARKRPRVIIYPRPAYLGPNAVRQCRSWLVTEYRVSGPVITPQMRCWWE